MTRRRKVHVETRDMVDALVQAQIAAELASKLPPQGQLRHVIEVVLTKIATAKRDVVIQLEFRPGQIDMNELFAMVGGSIIIAVYEQQIPLPETEPADESEDQFDAFRQTTPAYAGEPAESIA